MKLLLFCQANRFRNACITRALGCWLIPRIQFFFVLRLFRLAVARQFLFSTDFTSKWKKKRKKTQFDGSSVRFFLRAIVWCMRHGLDFVTEWRHNAYICCGKQLQHTPNVDRRCAKSHFHLWAYGQVTGIYRVLSTFYARISLLLWQLGFRRFFLSAVLFRAIRRRSEEPETNKIKLSVNSFCLSVRAEQEAINECDTFEFKLCGHTLTQHARAINGSCILIGPREIRSIAATCIPITFGCSPLVSRPLAFASMALRAKSQTMAINWFCTCCCMICSQYAVAVHTLRP